MLLLMVILIIAVIALIYVTKNLKSVTVTPHVNVNVKKPVGGCAGTRYGCCPNGTTPKTDSSGSNCTISQIVNN